MEDKVTVYINRRLIFNPYKNQVVLLRVEDKEREA